jgi:hypothetical protein
MNNIYILIIVLLIITPVLCKNIKETFAGFTSTSGLTHPTLYTFDPYYKNGTIDISHRGCETSHYWNCVDNHPLTKEGYLINNIPEKVDCDCKAYSNSKCYFPEIVSHTRNEPYFQYLGYV